MSPGALTFKIDGEAPTDISNQKASSDNFLARKGVTGGQIKKRKVTGCQIAQYLGSFNNIFCNFCCNLHFCFKFGGFPTKFLIE